ncbi:hypothetical protein Aduo_011711 [Ancylostoma duodenale]
MTASLMAAPACSEAVVLSPWSAPGYCRLFAPSRLLRLSAQKRAFALLNESKLGSDLFQSNYCNFSLPIQDLTHFAQDYIRTRGNRMINGATNL